MVPGAQRRVQSGGQSQDGSVLRGPKQPYWICSSCCDDRNWACRIQCRTCHKDASSKVIKAARAAHKVATAPSPKAAPQRAPGGAWSNGPPQSKLVDDLRRKLAAQNEKIKKLSAAKAAEADAEVDDGDHDMEGAVDVDALRRAAAAFREAGPSFADQAASLDAQIAERLREQRKAKPLSQQVRSLEVRLGRRKKALEAAQKAAADAEAAAIEAQQAAAAAKVRAQELEADVKRLEMEQMELCKRGVAPQDSAVAEQWDELRALHKDDATVQEAIALLSAKAAEMAAAKRSQPPPSAGAAVESKAAPPTFDANDPDLLRDLLQLIPKDKIAAVCAQHGVQEDVINTRTSALVSKVAAVAAVAPTVYASAAAGVPTGCGVSSGECPGKAAAMQAKGMVAALAGSPY